MSIRQALRADGLLYRQLRYGQRSRSITARISWYSSSAFLLLASYRFAYFFQKLRHTDGRRGKSAVLHALAKLCEPLVLIRTKSEISGATKIGDGVYLSHRGHLIIGARAIGSGSVIHHAVTIGMSTMSHGTPNVGTNVWIGPDCVLYGNIDIGDGATVLPGSVVSKSVPPGAVVKGNPGRIVQSGYDNAPLRSCLNYDVDVADLQSRE